MAKASFAVDLEAKNWLLGHLPEQVQAAYDADFIENPRGDAIIPDLKVHKWNQEKDLLIEIKRRGINKNCNNYPLSREQRFVDKNAEDIRKEYRTKCKSCDVRYASDTSGSGPFVTALESHAGGGVFPIIAGAFGEFNREVNPFLQKCARIAAAKDSGSSISPLDPRGKKSTAYNIFISQFRLVFGCLAIKAHIDIRHRRFQFIEKTREGASRTASQSAPSGSNTFRNERGSWFNMRDENRTYSEFCRFRNAHRSADNARVPFL